MVLFINTESASFFIVFYIVTIRVTRYQKDAPYFHLCIIALRHIH